MRERQAPSTVGARRRVALFVVIACALAWLVCLPLWLGGRGLTQPLTTICALVMMATPTISALVVHRLLGSDRQLAVVLGLRMGPWRRWLPYAFLAWLGPLVLSLLAVAVAAGARMLRTDLVHYSGYAEMIDRVTGGQPLPVSIQVLVVLSLVQVLVGAIINTLPAGLLDWLRVKAGNVYVPGLAHGAINASAGLPLVVAAAGSPPNSATTGLLGWTGWLVLATALAVLAILGRPGRR